MSYTAVTIDGEDFIVLHPDWWSKRQVEECIPYVVQDPQVIECQEIGAVMLAENELPDLAYDEGGQAPVSLHMLKKGKHTHASPGLGDRAREEGEAQAGIIRRMNLHALRSVLYEIAGDLQEACAGIHYPATGGRRVRCRIC